MQNFIIAAYALSGLLVAAAFAHAGDKKYVRVYGKTVAEAFAAGAQVAAVKDAELGGANCLKADTTIHILPKTEDGLYVAEVRYTLGKGKCKLKPKTTTSDEEGRSP